MAEQRQDAPVIRLVDSIIADAIQKGASDIHFEPLENGLRVRYRIDGILYDQDPVDAKNMQQVVSRLKIIAHIDIAERRVPQDGTFQITDKKGITDFRVSTFPSVHGETVVIRILDRSTSLMQLDQLGFDAQMLSAIKKIMQRSHGFFLVSGPTGAGKTTTLYAALAALNSTEKNCITLEDPVEYHVAGITQGQIHPEAGFTFEKGMRALLRQDPDIVLVGEIRDAQTAHIALQAALTGHLVLSTVHTNDAPSVIMRLMDMGIEPFLINAALSGVLAQRLARRICQACRESYAPSAEEKALLHQHGYECDLLYRGVGCDSCGGIGYKGRVGIFQLLHITSDLRALIVQHPQSDALHAQAARDGMHTLFDDGMVKVRSGLLSLHELIRVVA